MYLIFDIASRSGFRDTQRRIRRERRRGELSHFGKVQRKTLTNVETVKQTPVLRTIASTISLAQMPIPQL